MSHVMIKCVWFVLPVCTPPKKFTHDLTQIQHYYRYVCDMHCTFNITLTCSIKIYLINSLTTMKLQEQAKKHELNGPWYEKRNHRVVWLLHALTASRQGKRCDSLCEASFSSIYMSRAMRKCVLCHMRTTKAQISLRIHAVWSVPLLFVV